VPSRMSFCPPCSITTAGSALCPRRTPARNKGGGRTPGPFKDFLKRLRADPEFQATLERASKDETVKGYSAALKVITDYDDDKPAEKHAIVGPIEVRVSIKREGRRVTSS
jgi:hypothetical protein